MPGQRRVPPENASLRYLKLEAKRRVSAGEFPALHQAQLAIAREHGLPNWAVLKHVIDGQDRPEGRAAAQLRWLASRFAGARTGGWTPLGEAELSEHFTGQFLAQVPPDRLVAVAAGMAAVPGEELVITVQTPFFAQGRVAGHLISAATEAAPPHRVNGLRVRCLGTRISDPRTASPPVQTSGEVPDPVPLIAVATIGDLGLVGLSLAGGTLRSGGAPGTTWSAAAGWADLDPAEALRTGHRFPAYQITMVITAVGVLRLAADGRLGLDDPANRYLHSVRLADDAVTIRELLLHTGGVEDNLAGLYAPHALGPAGTAGTVLACTGGRGDYGLSHAGYAALGQLIAEVTGVAYPDAITRLVLGPVGMNESWFPASWPDTDAVASYEADSSGTFRPEPGMVCTIPAAGGLWTTAGDLVRFGLGWSSLLPRKLAREALRPQAPRPNGTHSGLGWIVNQPQDLAGHAGDGPSAAASLLVRLSDGEAHAALTSRQIPAEEVNARVLSTLTTELVQ